MQNSIIHVLKVSISKFLNQKNDVNKLKTLKNPYRFIEIA